MILGDSPSGSNSNGNTKVTDGYLQGKKIIQRLNCLKTGVLNLPFFDCSCELPEAHRSFETVFRSVYLLILKGEYDQKHSEMLVWKQNGNNGYNLV